ncbi:hypothetical protein BDP27DRAFT_1435150 [Rhodocollybia butyracea]|uniref:Uncharacterized protein n=1 Tax=Rhodocollybia butyracea TaxID=206335 RepID=A0A9P5P592_9AGAR|nr:hypothetical protein BDP27DRAFT_1435150 [Rhodocollybia butyracea]
MLPFVASLILEIPPEIIERRFTVKWTASADDQPFTLRLATKNPNALYENLGGPFDPFASDSAMVLIHDGFSPFGVPFVIEAIGGDRVEDTSKPFEVLPIEE